MLGEHGRPPHEQGERELAQTFARVVSLQDRHSEPEVLRWQQQVRPRECPLRSRIRRYETRIGHANILAGLGQRSHRLHGITLLWIDHHPLVRQTGAFPMRIHPEQCLRCARPEPLTIVRVKLAFSVIVSVNADREYVLVASEKGGIARPSATVIPGYKGETHVVAGASRGLEKSLESYEAVSSPNQRVVDDECGGSARRVPTSVA